MTLGQGDLYFGKSPEVISTLLGSCVAVTLWHPTLHIGGMCHVVVPQRLKEECDYRYPCCAVERFMKDTVLQDTKPEDYQVGIYGGGNMFPNIQMVKGQQVGQRNIESMQKLINESGFILSEFHIGGNSYRRVTLHLESGEVIVSGHDVETTELVTEVSE